MEYHRNNFQPQGLPCSMLPFRPVPPISFPLSLFVTDREMMKPPCITAKQTYMKNRKPKNCNWYTVRCINKKSKNQKKNSKHI